MAWGGAAKPKAKADSKKSPDGSCRHRQEKPKFHSIWYLYQGFGIPRTLTNILRCLAGIKHTAHSMAELPRAHAHMLHK